MVIYKQIAGFFLDADHLYDRPSLPRKLTS